MEILLFIFGVIGLTHIIVDSAIMQPIRDWFKKPYVPWFLMWKDGWGDLLSPWTFLRKRLFDPIGHMTTCYQCSGFWAGLAVGWMVWSQAGFWHVLASGFAGSFLSNAAAILFNYFEAQTIVHLPPEDNG